MACSHGAASAVTNDPVVLVWGRFLQLEGEGGKVKAGSS
jgi:hypothetical protein